MVLTVLGFSILRLAVGVSPVISETKTVSFANLYVSNLSVAADGSPSNRMTWAFVERRGVIPRHGSAWLENTSNTRQQELNTIFRINVISQSRDEMKGPQLIERKHPHPEPANKDDVR